MNIVRGVLVAAVALACCVLLPAPLSAFKVRAVPSWPPNHENITASAIISVMAAPDPLLIRNIQQGVINTDLTHFNENEYHFDNSTVSNGAFANGFDVLAGMALRAHAEAMLCDGTHPCGVLNPLFIHPQHSNYRELIEAIVGTYLNISVTNGCLREPACWGENLEGRAAFLQTALLPALVDVDPDPDITTVLSNGVTTNSLPNMAPAVLRAKADLDDALAGKVCRPWPEQGLCFEGIGVMAPADASFHLLVGQLQLLQLEYQAYFAWQHLGHAMHTTEDFFAHSNYVELVSCRKGPPCTANSFNVNSCDVPLDGGPASWNSLPLPADGKPLQDLVQFFLPNFDLPSLSAMLNAQRAVFQDGNAPHLQTGHFPCTSATDPPDAPFLYCHTAGGDLVKAIGNTPTPAGMNKDQAYPSSSDSELNHQNFDWARATATRSATALYASFLASFPDGPLLLSPTPLAAASPTGPRPSCGIAVSVAPPRVTVFGAPSSSPPETIVARPAKPLVLIPRPLTPQLAALATTPAFRSPVLSHPELLQRDPRPRIYVIVSPNRAFHPGEQVQIQVDAFDAASGVAVPGMPVSIGAARGTTGTPFALTIPSPSSQRCALYDGQNLCLNAPGALAGIVEDPAGRYPGGGGRFSLSLIFPKLTVALAGGPALAANVVSFSVSALDSQTGVPVGGASVAVAGHVVGPANAPLTYKWASPALIVNKAAATASGVTLGPPMIVSAPGYGDALVHYYLISTGSALPPR